MTKFMNQKLVQRHPLKRFKKDIFKTKDVEELNENKYENTEEVMMTTQEKIDAANSILASQNIKKIKKDKGLIERTESSTTILTEDNKELLKD